MVLVSYGRSNTPEDLGPQLDELWAAIGEQLPSAERYVVVAPPRLDGLPPTDGATRAWAEGSGAPLIDVAQVFAEEGIVEGTLSGRDPLAVNIYGSDRWAQIVHDEVLDTPAGR